MLKENPFLQVFQKIALNKNSRLQPDSLKTVVSRVRILQKRGDPTNCSYNPSAIIKDSDLALEQMKRREYDFNQTMQKELSKLNTTMTRQKNTLSGDYSHDSPLSPSKDLLIGKNLKTGTKSPQDRSMRFNSYSPALVSARNNLNKNVYQRLSTPVPGISTKRGGKGEINQYTVEQVDRVLNECLRFTEDMKKTKVNYENRGEKGRGKEEHDGMLTDKQRDELLLEDQFGFNVKMAKVCVRGRKIWKMNHVSFIATVDRMMNSVPLVKK